MIEPQTPHPIIGNLYFIGDYIIQLQYYFNFPYLFMTFANGIITSNSRLSSTIVTAKRILQISTYGLSTQHTYSHSILTTALIKINNVKYNNKLSNATKKQVREKIVTGGDETAIVLHTLVSATSWFLLLVLLSYFRCLPSHLPCTCQRSVYLSCYTHTLVRVLIFILIEIEDWRLNIDTSERC